MSKPTTQSAAMKLLEFPHSHYCEKARWALQYKGLQFKAVAILPGLHLLTVRRHAPQTFVPVLLLKERVVQGAGEIIDYLEEVCPSPGLTPADSELELCRFYEKDLAERLGVTIRQILYQRLLAYPDFIRYCFTQNMPGYKKVIFRLLYPGLKKAMHQRYDVVPAGNATRASVSLGGDSGFNLAGILR